MTQHNIQPKDAINEDWLSNVGPSDWKNPTPSGRYNLLVIGGGSAGLLAAVGATGVGAKVALVEKSLLGGDCLNVGCVPSKTIIRSAKVIGELRHAKELGINVPDGVTADFGAVMERMRQVRANISHHDSAERFKGLGIDTFFGEGKFTSANTFEIRGQTIEFKKAVIATGSRPFELPIPGLAEAGFLTNESVFFSLTELPPRMAVIGGGPIGAELAQSFQRLGAQVTIFDVAPQILSREDPEAAAIVQASLVEDGVQLQVGASIKEVKMNGDDKVIMFESGGEMHELAVDEILLAVGRRPNIEGLGLEAAGVEYHKRGLTVNDRLETTNPNIYGAGDVAMKYQFTHAADAAARIVIRNALFLGRQKVSDLLIPWVTFTDPEVAHVGMYEKDAKEAGVQIDTFTTYLQDIDRGRADKESGFVKIHVKKGSDKIVGATIVGRHAGEMIGEICVAMRAGAGMKLLADTIHPYPTQTEAIRKTAEQWNRTRLTPTVANLFDRWMAWTR